MTSRCALFGLTIEAPFEVSGAHPTAPGAQPDVVVTYGAVARALDGAVASDDRWDAAPGRFLWRGGPRSGRFLVEAGARVTFDPNPGCEGAVRDSWFVTAVLAAICRQRGMLVLHADAAVLPDGDAIGICGESGTGKSTTTAALLQRGLRLLTDDVLALRADADGAVWAMPGVMRLNLWEDAARTLGHEVAALEPQPLRAGKVRLPVTDAVREPARLRALYALRPGAGDRVEMRPLTGAERFAALHEAIYGPQIADDHGEVFPHTAATAAIPVVEVARPSDGWSADKVAAAVNEACAPAIA